MVVVGPLLWMSPRDEKGDSVYLFSSYQEIPADRNLNTSHQLFKFHHRRASRLRDWHPRQSSPYFIRFVLELHAFDDELENTLSPFWECCYRNVETLSCGAEKKTKKSWLRAGSCSG